MMEEKRLRAYLTYSITDFDDIVLGRKLGANSNIFSIICMLKDVIEQVKTGACSEESGINAIKEITAYFDRIRGDSTVAVRNAIKRLLFDADKNGSENFIKTVKKNSEQYLKESADWNNQIAKTALPFIEKKTALMVYDFSSSVDYILTKLVEHKRKIDIYVPESRTLDGGIPFIKNHLNTCLSFKFIPDCAMAYYIQRCDAALVGVETFCADGGLYNTTGSLMLGIICKEYKIPYYAVTQFLKLDETLRENGTLKELAEYDMRAVLHLEVEGSNVAAYSIGIEHVPSKYITGYFTEKGYIEASEIEKYI